MAYLTTELEFKSYMFRKLGSEVHTVEITDLQWTDIFNDAQETFYDYSGYGVIDKIVVVDTMGQTELSLADNITSIKACYGVDNIYDNIHNILLPMSTFYFYAMTNVNAENQMSSYVVQKQYLNTIQDLLSEQVAYDFNPVSKTLWLGKSYNRIAFKLGVKEPIEKLLDNKFLKLIVEEKMWRQWATNIGGKYESSSAPVLGNGMILNTQGMLEQADRLREEWENGINEDEYDTLLAPQRLYN